MYVEKMFSYNRNEIFAILGCMWFSALEHDKILFSSDPPHMNNQLSSQLHSWDPSR